VIGTIGRHVARYSAMYAALGFGLGLLVGRAFPLADLLKSGLEVIVGLYGTIAPLIIFCILAPSLLRIHQHEGAEGRQFAIYTVLWFAKLRLLACLSAVVLVSVVYTLPFAGGGSVEGVAFATALRSLGRGLVRSPYFLAIYASILGAGLLWRRKGRLVRAFAHLPELVEKLGEALTCVVPVFTLLVGIHVVTLPQILAAHFAEYPTSTFGKVALFGRQFDTTTASGILVIYVLVALLTGLICSLWHAALLLCVRYKLPGLSIRTYFTGYFLKLYPLLWSTCSEALATPLNMHLLKELYPQIDPAVRRFAVGLGSVININGTLICCFVMVPAVCMMLGLPISVPHLLLCFPIIYILGFGVPGIPGELVLFAGPIMSVLTVPEPLQAAFLLTFLGLQIGLPDSFRTGANSTDAGPALLLLNEAYRRRFQARRVDGMRIRTMRG
jgi:Na+/H+-dicarboxylate symporter